MSTKKVREQLEKTFKCDLNSRRQEIKEIVMDIVNSKESNEEDGSASESESEEEEEPAPKSKKRASTARKASPAKKKKKASSEEEDGSEADGNSDDNDSDYDAKPKKAAKGRKKGGRRKKGSDSDSDEDWKQTKKPKKVSFSSSLGYNLFFLDTQLCVQCNNLIVNKSKTNTSNFSRQKELAVERGGVPVSLVHIHYLLI